MIRKLLLLSGFLFFLAVVAGCAARPEIESTSPAAQVLDPLAQAAAEATVIVQKARATAIVLQAEVQAAALIEQAQQPPEAVPSAQIQLLVTPSTNPTPLIQATSQAAAGLQSFQETPTNMVMDYPVIASQGDFNLLGVTFAADGGFIMVSFTAPPNAVAQLYQGTVSVTDESNGAIYDEIPVMPVIGPLIGRPVELGQRGYVMLSNKPPGLKPGALVTIVLGDVIFEHIQVGNEE